MPVFLLIQWKNDRQRAMPAILYAVYAAGMGTEMIVAKVIETVISTRKHSALQGLKLLVVQSCENSRTETLIAGDILGAGIGEYVLVTRGEPAAYALEKQAPIDAMVVGLIDRKPEYLQEHEGIASQKRDKE